MIQGHDHSASLKAGENALTISGWLTGIYFVIELSIGLYTGSIAVISDAFHTFSAVGGVVLAIAAARIARRPADIHKTYGWYRAEIIGALLNGAFLFVMAVVVVVMGAMRLNQPIDLPTGPMLLAAIGGLVTEFISLFYLYRQQGSDLNIRGAYWHVLQTFIGSLIIILAVVVIQFTGFLAIDPILGMVFGFVLLWASWGLMRDATHLLMEGTPIDIDLASVVRSLTSLTGVRDVHHAHAWALTSDRYLFSAHLRLKTENPVNPSVVLAEAHRVLTDKFQFYFSTIQIETECLDESSTAEFDVVGDAAAKKPNTFPHNGGHQ